MNHFLSTFLFPASVRYTLVSVLLNNTSKTRVTRLNKLLTIYVYKKHYTNTVMNYACFQHSTSLNYGNENSNRETST